jgi:predicted  nucleic acid-binding Zn-ribbon protein
LARKYINREDKKGLDAKKEVAAEDEWAHLTGVEDSGIEVKIEKKIEAVDAADVGDRTIIFGNQQQLGSKTKLDIVRQEARNAMDAAGNTGQYIRFVNKHIDNQRREIDKIKKIKERFDHEIDLLQSNRNKIDSLNNNLLPKPDVKTITESLHQLLLEKGITKSKLDNLKNEIGAVEEELQQQENQIEEVSEEIKNKKIVSLNDNKKEKMKEDLEALMKKYGVTNLSDLEKIMNK